MISKTIKTTFILGLLFYLIYYLATGDVFGRNDLGDKAFHILKIKDPLGYPQSSYYAPVFHILVFPFAKILSVKLALSLIIPTLGFLILPIVFSLAWLVFADDIRGMGDAAFYSVYVSYFLSFTLFTTTWPQLLNMIWMLGLLTLMFLDLWIKFEIKNLNWPEFRPVIAILSLIGFFTHSEGGIWILATLLLYLALRGSDLWTLAGGLTLLLASQVAPGLFTRGYHMITRPTFGIYHNLIAILGILLLWVNPLNAYLIVQGARQRLQERGQPSKSDVLLACSALIAITTGIFEQELRPILSGITILGLYGVYGLRKYPQLKKPFQIWTLTWAAIYFWAYFL